MASAWYILTVVPGYEDFVRKEIICNKHLVSKNIVTSKFFSGYVFLKIELNKCNLSDFFDIDGTVDFLGKKNIFVKGKKITIPEEISKRKISKMLGIVEDCYEQKIKPNCIKFEIGDEVIINSGDLSGIQGIIVDLKKRIVRIKPNIFLNNLKLIKVKTKDIELVTTK
jgi:transcription antitermination factor NusG